jgi:hypothetical protein
MTYQIEKFKGISKLFRDFIILLFTALPEYRYWPAEWNWYNVIYKLNSPLGTPRCKHHAPWLYAYASMYNNSVHNKIFHSWYDGIVNINTFKDISFS